MAESGIANILQLDTSTITDLELADVQVRYAAIELEKAKNVAQLVRLELLIARLHEAMGIATTKTTSR